MEKFAAIKAYPGFDEEDYQKARASGTARIDKFGALGEEEKTDLIASMMGYKRSGHKRTQPGGSPPRQCYVPGEDLVKRRPEINPLMRWDFDFTREDHLFMALCAMRERAADMGNLFDFTIGRMSVFIHWISGSDFYNIYHSCAPGEAGDCKTWEEAIYKAVVNFSVAVDAGLFDHGLSGTRPPEVVIDDELAEAAGEEMLRFNVEASQGGAKKEAPRYCTVSIHDETEYPAKVGEAYDGTYGPVEIFYEGEWIPMEDFEEMEPGNTDIWGATDYRQNL